MDKWKPEKQYISIGIVIFCVFLACLAVYYLLFHMETVIDVLRNLRKILVPVIDGMLIAYFVTPFLNMLEGRIVIPLWIKSGKKVNKKTKNPIRGISILLSFGIVICIIYIILSLIIPQVADSIRYISTRLTVYRDSLLAFVEDILRYNPLIEEQATTMLQNMTEELNNLFNKYMNLKSLSDLTQIPFVQSMLKNVVSFVVGVWHFIIGFIISIYMLFSKETFSAQAKKITYSMFSEPAANRIIMEARNANRIFSGFFSGKLMDSLIIGILCFICVTILKMPFPVLVSVIVGVTNMIPFFGPFLGAIPSVILIFVEDPSKCLTFLVFILILQQFDGNILGPKILGDSTGLPGFWVIFAITLFGGMWGIPGMFFGVPIFAVIYDAIRRLTLARVKDKELPMDTNKYRGVKAFYEGDYYPLGVKDTTEMNRYLILNELEAINEEDSVEAQENEISFVVNVIKHFNPTKKKKKKSTDAEARSFEENEDNGSET